MKGKFSSKPFLLTALMLSLVVVLIADAPALTVTPNAPSAPAPMLAMEHGTTAT